MENEKCDKKKKKRKNWIVDHGVTDVAVIGVHAARTNIFKIPNVIIYYLSIVACALMNRINFVGKKLLQLAMGPGALFCDIVVHWMTTTTMKCFLRLQRVFFFSVHPFVKRVLLTHTSKKNSRKEKAWDQRRKKNKQLNEFVNRSIQWYIAVG